MAVGYTRSEYAVGGGLTEEQNEKLKKKLADNKDLFAWTVEDMLGIDPRVMSHRLSVCKEVKVFA